MTRDQHPSIASPTWRGRPAPLARSWRFPGLSRRWRTTAVVATPLAAFAVASWWFGDFLAALFVSGMATVAGYTVLAVLVLMGDRDETRGAVEALDRRVSGHALFRRQVQANTEAVEGLDARLRFVEQMTFGVPQQSGTDDKRREIG